MESVRDELALTGSESKEVAGFCRAVNEISEAIRCGQFIEWIRNY
jgi:hypothetical protein